MILVDYILIALYFVVLVFMLVSVFFDWKKKRVIKKYPFISFIIPTYKDADTLSSTIKHVFNSYKKQGKFEVIIVNDCSPDNTLEVLKKLKKTYPITVITNKKNMGKVAGINNASKSAKGEVIFIVDSDTNLNSKAVNDIVARLNDPRVGGVSCRYRSSNKGFFAEMQTIEYGMLGLLQISCNRHSTLSFWGGCMAVKKNVFEKVGRLSPNAIIEDADMALKIGATGYLAQESQYSIESDVPGSLISWYKQKVRWTSGLMQNLIKHRAYFIKHPIALILFGLYGLMSIFFMVSLITIFLKIRIIDFETEVILSMDRNYFIYPLFSIPYVIMNMP